MKRFKTITLLIVIGLIILAIKDIASNDVNLLGKTALFFIFYCVPIPCIYTYRSNMFTK